ncbi:hypothetical protein SPI_05722 [Niveomyces insectorum RCEF 264]|uniref:Uncharacterized protein n=1 Tax=Niveomyces insectorum RCEF 264 TaxID=1081102 RepID=A0A167TH32_9HYPO|nr:hypothetical protein SPI_05722 [Niveomyces insectorum RCEF 264]
MPFLIHRRLSIVPVQFLSPNLDTLVDYAAFLENVARRVGCEPRLPLVAVALYNAYMAPIGWMALHWLKPAHHLAPASMWHPVLLWAATVAGFLLYRDGLLIKWWLYPQWPVWYRQRGPGANPTLLQGVLNRVPLWKYTAITRGFIWLLRLLSLPLFLPHLLLEAAGIRFREAWGGLLRPKMVVLHSGIWRLLDLFMPTILS